MICPVKKEYVTQEFGVNKANYIQFGLQGHNGIDFRAFLPDGSRCYSGGKSEIFAPHDGKILENTYDAGGYGNYVKIQSDKEGSVLAHMSSLCTLPVGSVVKEGDFIGYQGTTGNSTGIHLHWGYYKLPRNRNNGYNGYINQAGLYSPNTGVNMPTALETCLTDRQKFWDERDEMYRALGFNNQENALSEIKRLKDFEAQWSGHKCPECPIVPPAQPTVEKLVKIKKIYNAVGELLTVEKTYTSTNS